ncbi:MAG: hypothetical protein IJ808_06835 [Muribaculaceae bacterium]|nr:hypothetical protein [Muribaculaceae bacterium]
MTYTEQSHISSLSDVRDFACYLYNKRKVAFHPDDDFADYVNDETQKPTFTKEEVSLFNRLTDECFEVCERENADIYEVMTKFNPIFAS